MLPRFLSLIVLLCFSSSLIAQTESRDRYLIYGGYSLLSNSFNGVPGARQMLNGWDASVVFQSWHNLRFKFESSGYNGSNLGAQQHALFLMGGGQYSLQLGKEAVFAEVLAGEARLNRYWGPNRVAGEVASFSSILGGGVDTPLTRHLAFRVAGDYLWENFALQQNVTLIPYRPAGLPNNFARISSGLVWRF
jgi:hypothetical protein